MTVPADVYTRSPRVYRGLAELTYPFHDATVTVTRCGRLCWHGRKINLSLAFAGQNVGRHAGQRPRLARDLYGLRLGYFDDEAGRVEPIDNPFGAKVLPMCSE